MTIRKTTLKRLAMTAVMLTTAYQGLLFASDFEASQKAAALKIPSHSDMLASSRTNDNAAPLYSAAGQLVNGYDLRRRSKVSLKTLAEERSHVTKEVQAAAPALDLVARATSMAHCNFGPGELYAGLQVDYLGLRSVVQAGCLQMMLWAEAGDSSQAIALGRNLATMIAQVDRAPTLIRHSVSVSLADQLGNTARELREAYPSDGYEAMSGDLSKLAQSLDEQLPEVPRLQAGVDLYQLNEVEDGNTRGSDFENVLPFWTQFGVRNAKVQMLEIATRTEEALKTHNRTDLALMATEMEGREGLVACLTPNWSKFVARHDSVVASLRSFSGASLAAR